MSSLSATRPAPDRKTTVKMTTPLHNSSRALLPTTNTNPWPKLCNLQATVSPITASTSMNTNDTNKKFVSKPDRTHRKPCSARRLLGTWRNDLTMGSDWWWSIYWFLCIVFSNLIKYLYLICGIYMIFGFFLKNYQFFNQ